MVDRTAKPPHILFLLTDQQRADCLGCAGHPLLRTPNIDRLANRGTRFTDCFTTSPLCVPARMSLANGLYPHNSNLWTGDVTLPLNSDTYMHRLRDNGYRTATIGKNHLFPMENCDLYANEPNYHTIGFDDVEDMSGTWGVIGGKSVYTDYLSELGLMESLRKYLAQLEAQPDSVRRYVAEPLPIPAEHYIDAFIARRVAHYVEQYDSERPSFMFVGFQGPHEPWDAPDGCAMRFDLASIPDAISERPPGAWLPERSRRYERWAQYYPPSDVEALRRITARYYGKIAQIDDAVARILAAYQRKGWLEQTAVIFASDHGEMLGDLGRLSKSVFYESALRVPLIVCLPDGAGVGRVCSALTESIDIYATILDIAGCEDDGKKDACSLMPLIRGTNQAGRQDVLSEVHAHTMLRTHDFKLVIGRGGETLQLFDLHNDPLEQTNLCSHPDCAQRELELRSCLLTRVVRDTLRLGNVDPEHCEHALLT